MKSIGLWLCMLAAAAGCTGLAKPDAELYPAPPRDAITFWGHACVYIDVAGMGIVTDPVWDKTRFQRSRRLPAPPAEAYAQARVVLVSHAHDDHLSPRTLRTFPKDTVFLCPQPCVEHIDDMGQRVRAMRPGDTFEAGEVRITAVMAHHPGGRYGLFAKADGNALGYVIATPAATIFYSGDTDYFSGFSDVGWKHAIDVAILNVNGHLPATDATRAAWALQAAVVIPTHWGGYKYWLRGGNKRPRDRETIERILGARYHVLEVGESLPLASPIFRRGRPTGTPRRRRTGPGFSRSGRAAIMRVRRRG
jgi:L-ascorbate metabolism protein UlaG (beta-lactamase superfamily)